MTSAMNVSLLLLLTFAVCGQADGFATKPSWRSGMENRLQADDGSFRFEETTISDIQAAFNDGRLTSSQLVEYYLDQIRTLNPYLNAVIEVNPDALDDAAKADFQRNAYSHLSPLHGIPVLVKDNINTHDKLNTTSGSFALLGSVVPRDAGVIQRLRNAGAIILGKASMSEWDNFRALDAPQGWSPRGGQGQNPYSKAINPCGTSSGSAIAVAANLVTVSLATDLDGAITCPAVVNSVVGIKPTVGLTSRSGMVPISPRLQTIGPMARTVADAVALLDVIMGFDPLDAEATEAAEKFIPKGGFYKSLKEDGLKGKRIGILRHPYVDMYPIGSMEANTFAANLQTMRLKGAILVDNLEMKNREIMENITLNGEIVSLLAEFKLSLNAYLDDLVSSPVRSLADVIAFNNNHSIEEKINEYGQIVFLVSQKTNGIGLAEKEGIETMAQLSKEGMEGLMKQKSLDAVLFPEHYASNVMSLGAFPIISVPAGYNSTGEPLGISWFLLLDGLQGSDAILIEIAYAFEQATQARIPPPTLV
ncbi:LOW QUALITY PROTEIN: putative amidase C869.01 [Phalaenopsis equestris]|uniref:LOW QUALITY PROTEIN: putative amidase C869.01 n=1 Tax=Phalaenopsis equestris TaxID=78828 RepID=UPI0009E61942|nr:LOW QUALITY PROTEIN: putative amidase C869.01 [Phalaenopsis equestris]